MKIDEMDDLYEIVGQELKNGEERPGLMARATAEADGNPEKAKSLYIRYRVAEIAEKRQREAENRVRDEIRVLVGTQGFVPELLAETRTSIPGFDTLSLGEKVQEYLNFEWPERLLRTADEKLHQRSDIEGAIQRYERVIKRFPDTKQADYAKQQLSDMDLVRHGAIPEILEQARKLSGFDDLPLEEKLRWYMKFESPEILYRAGRHKHYEDGDTDAAVQRYNRVIERFPFEKEARYAQQQLDKIRAGVHPPEEIQALLAQRLTIDSCQEILTLLGHKVTMQENGKWTVQEPSGSKRFLYSFPELETYTKETATLALAKPRFKSPESPPSKSDAPFEAFSALSLASSSPPKSATRQSESLPKTETPERSYQEAKPQKKHANWPLRIALYIALFVSWILAAGLLQVFIRGVRHGLLEQVLARHMAVDQAATYVGIIAGVGQFLLLSAISLLAIFIWRKTRRV